MPLPDAAPGAPRLTRPARHDACARLSYSPCSPRDWLTFRKCSQSPRRSWTEVCAASARSSGNTISYTPLGRAYNRWNPALGQTMNAAMLAVIYGNAIAPPNATELEAVRCPLFWIG